MDYGGSNENDFWQGKLDPSGGDFGLKLDLKWKVVLVKVAGIGCG